MTVEIGVVISILALVIAFLGYSLKKNNVVKTDSRESAEMRAELGYIRKGVDDIRIDLRTNERQMVHLGERVTRIEESAKQAHKRLDNIEKGSD